MLLMENFTWCFKIFGSVWLMLWVLGFPGYSDEQPYGKTSYVYIIKYLPKELRWGTWPKEKRQISNLLVKHEGRCQEEQVSDRLEVKLANGTFSSKSKQQMACWSQQARFRDLCLWRGLSLGHKRLCPESWQNTRGAKGRTWTHFLPHLVPGGLNLGKTAEAARAYCPGESAEGTVALQTDSTSGLHHVWAGWPQLWASRFTFVLR